MNVSPAKAAKRAQLRREGTDQMRRVEAGGGECVRSRGLRGVADARKGTAASTPEACSKSGGGAVCFATTTAGVRSVPPSMQHDGGAVRHPFLQQACGSFAPAVPAGMKHSPLAARDANAAASTSAATRRCTPKDDMASMTPPGRPAVKGGDHRQWPPPRWSEPDA